MGIRGVWAAGVAAACALLSGCWTQIGFDAGHTRFNSLESGLTSANVGALAQDWSVPLRTVSSEPMVRGGRVYLATSDTASDPFPQEVHARAVDAATGATVWDNELFSWCCLESSRIGAAPVTLVGDEVWTGFESVITSPQFNTFRAPIRLSADDGSTLSTVSDFLPSPAVEDGPTVVQVKGSSTLFGIGLVVRDKATQETLWQAGLPVIGAPPPPPTVVDGQIFVPSGPFMLAFPDADCGQDTCPFTWDVNMGAGTLQSSTAFPGGKTVFATTQAGELLAVDRATGQIVWRTGALATPIADAAVAQGVVYVVAGSTLYAFAAGGCGAATCAPLWTGADVTASGGGPVVAGGVVYAGARGGVAAFAAGGCGATTCPASARVAVAGEVRHLTVAQGRLFVVSANPGRLTAFSAH